MEAGDKGPTMPPVAQAGSRVGEARQLVRRAIAGVIMATVALGIVWLGDRPFSALVAFLCIMLVFEWTRLVEKAEFSSGFYILSFTAISSVFLAASGLYGYAYLCALAGGLFAVIMEYTANRASLWPLIGVFYVIMPCVALVWIRAEPGDGRALVIFLMAAVWATDIGAYLIGRALGGPRLAPKISPGKTWSGTAGGVICGTLVCALLGLFGIGNGPEWLLALIGAGLSVSTIIGDLAESAFKRYFGVKDSGGYIPGHGGILDRLDGMIFATVALAIVLYVYSLL